MTKKKKKFAGKKKKKKESRLMYTFVLPAYDPQKTSHDETQPFNSRQFDSKLLFFFLPSRFFPLVTIRGSLRVANIH